MTRQRSTARSTRLPLSLTLPHQGEGTRRRLPIRVYLRSSVFICGSRSGTSVLKSNRDIDIRAVVVRPKARGADAVGRQLLVPLLHVPRHADRSDDLTAVVADQQATTLGEDAAVGGPDQV